MKDEIKIDLSITFEKPLNDSDAECLMDLVKIHLNNLFESFQEYEYSVTGGLLALPQEKEVEHG